MRFSAREVSDALFNARCTKCVLDVPDAFFNAIYTITLFASDVPSDQMCYYDEPDALLWSDAQLEPDVHHRPDVLMDQIPQRTRCPCGSDAPMDQMSFQTECLLGLNCIHGEMNIRRTQKNDKFT